MNWCWVSQKLIVVVSRRCGKDKEIFNDLVIQTNRKGELANLELQKDLYTELQDGKWKVKLILDICKLICMGIYVHKSRS